MCADVHITKSVSYSGSYIYCHNGLLWGQWVVISVSPACCVELVEVVCSGRVGVDVLVEVVLPGGRGGGGGVGERREREQERSIAHKGCITWRDVPDLVTYMCYYKC